MDNGERSEFIFYCIIPFFPIMDRVFVYHYNLCGCSGGRFLFKMAKPRTSSSGAVSSAKKRAKCESPLGKIILLSALFVILCAICIAAAAVIDLRYGGAEAASNPAAEVSSIIEENTPKLRAPSMQEAPDAFSAAYAAPPAVPHDEHASAQAAPEGAGEAAFADAPFMIPPAQNGAVLVFVFDDAGLHADNVRRYTALPFPVTVAVLPALRQSKASAAIVRDSGNEVILHQPMQALNRSLDPGPGAILPDMPPEKIISVLKTNVSELAPLQGLNNHEGSLITENLSMMETVLAVAGELGIFFLDSKTTAKSKGRQAADLLGMDIYERDVFIDDVVTRRVMLAQIYRGIAIANRSGSAILIGHVDKSVDILPQLLSDLYPHLVKQGYRFSTVSNSPIKRGER